MRVCKVKGCGGEHKARGYCRTHYLHLPDVLKRTREVRLKYVANNPEYRERERQYKREKYYDNPEWIALKEKFNRDFARKRAAKRKVA